SDQVTPFAARLSRFNEKNLAYVPSMLVVNIAMYPTTRWTMYSRQLLGGAVFLAMALCGGAARAQEGGETYEEAFKGKPRKGDDFTLIGADAAACVKFKPEGLRINMPAGKSRGTTGVATMFGITGDFEITVRYEVLFEPDMADSGAPNTGTRLSLTA